MSIYEVHSTMTYHSLMKKSKSDLARMVLEYADMDATVLKGKRDAEANVEQMRAALFSMYAHAGVPINEIEPNNLNNALNEASAVLATVRKKEG